MRKGSKGYQEQRFVYLISVRRRRKEKKKKKKKKKKKQR
jgi:hypothetical protein